MSLILGATAVASIASYLLIWLVPRQIGLEAYKDFGLFWAAMYFVVGALSGLQQEVTRGTVRRSDEIVPTVSPARNFGLAVSGIVFLAVVVSSPLWIGSVFPGEGWPLVLPLAFATTSYVMVATLAGTLYGIAGWVPLALMISVDGVLRFVAVCLVASVTDDTVALAWAAALPFLITIAVLWPGIRRVVVGKTALDVGYRALSRNVAGTMVAAASMGVLVSGFPVVLGIAAAGEPAAFVASLFLAITITRAPVIVVVMSLQSYLIVRFRDHPGSFWRDFLALQAIILGGAVVLSVLAWLVGAAVFDFLYGGQIDLDGWFYAALVASSALVGCLAVTAPAVLALSQHAVYSLGWVVAAIVTIGCFVLPFDLMTNTVVSLLAGPVAGLLVHAPYLLIHRSRRISAARA